MNVKSQEMEQQFIDAKAFVEEHDRFLVVSHLHPDGDAISSTCAVAYLLDKLGKSYVLMNEDTLPPRLHYLYQSEQIKQYSDELNETYDVVITVDCADFSRIGKVSSLIEPDAKLLNIDHHPTNDRYGTCQLIVPTAAATVEILYDFISRFDIEWNEQIAACIYTGLLTDTGGFRYANTSPKVMNIAADLLQYGVKGHELAELLLEKTTMSHIRILQRALNTLSFAADHRISWVCVSKQDFEQTGATNHDLEGLVSYPRNIEGVEVGVLFKELGPNEVKVSLRSTGKVNVAEVAQFFGGGGHVLAAGATLECSLDEAAKRVVDKLRQVVPSND